MKSGKEKENKKSPIFFLEYEHQLINGNHRMAEAYENSIEYQNGYIVKTNIYIDWLITEYMKRVYQLNQDLVNINKYLNYKEQGLTLQWEEEDFINKFLHIKYFYSN